VSPFLGLLTMIESISPAIEQEMSPRPLRSAPRRGVVGSAANPPSIRAIVGGPTCVGAPVVPAHIQFRSHDTTNPHDIHYICTRGWVPGHRLLRNTLFCSTLGFHLVSRPEL
jgi:hypothetical protein